MTQLKYIMASGVCKTGELLELKRNNPDDYDILVKWAEEEMRFNNIPIDVPVTA